MTEQLKIIFAGTPEIAATVLKNILAHGFKVELVLSQPDRPAGRGMKLTPSPVKKLALAAGIEVFQPLSFKSDPAAVAKLDALNADIMVVVAYGLLLPEEVLKLPRRGCVNIHVSILPKWRGAAPIQRALLAGDSQTGVSIMQMDKGLDTGDVLLFAGVAIASDETSASLHDKLAQVGAEKIVEFLAAPDNFSSVPQPELGVSYAKKLTKEEARINWQQPAALIERKIRGYNPFPGAYSYLDGLLYKIWQVQLLTDETLRAVGGTIIRQDADCLWVVCGDGQVLSVLQLQSAGGKRQPIAQFLQGVKSPLLAKQFERLIHE